MRRKIAVLLIDMQEGFVSRLPEGEKERIVPNQIEIIRRCVREEIPLFVIELDRHEYKKTIPELETEALSLKEKNLRFVRKQSNSAFCGTNLQSMLEEMNITTLLLMGINADRCVMDTALDAIKVGYSIMTSKDVVSSSFSNGVSRFMKWLRIKRVFGKSVTAF